MSFTNPFDLAARQTELDRQVAGHSPDLLARKVKKLTASPLGFFRGSARLFYEILAHDKDLALDGGPTGHVVGDMHLENVGAYRTDSDELVFDLNDFDDSMIAPVWVDRLRVAVSVLLAGRAFQATAVDALNLVGELLDSYDEAFSGAPVIAFPKPIVELCERASKRTRKELLDMRAPLDQGKRKFVLGERYLPLSGDESAALPALMEAYKTALGARAPKHAASWRLIDATTRVAGTGSLGRRRIAFLIADASDVERLFELKEAAAPSAEVLFGSPPTEFAARVTTAASSLVAAPPRQLAALEPTVLGSFIGRKLCPEEDKLDLARLSVGPKLSSVSRVVGGLLGRAHRRDIGDKPFARDREELLDRAVLLAAIFESVYLAFCRQTMRKAPTNGP